MNKLTDPVLKQEDREKLKGIILKMTDVGESEDDIQLLVNKFRPMKLV